MRKTLDTDIWIHPDYHKHYMSNKTFAPYLIGTSKYKAVGKYCASYKATPRTLIP